jgi:hypothetical protein
MGYIFPSTVPEVSVSDMDRALEYYQQKLGFNKATCSRSGLAMVRRLSIPLNQNRSPDYMSLLPRIWMAIFSEYSTIFDVATGSSVLLHAPSPTSV